MSSQPLPEETPSEIYFKDTVHLVKDADLPLSVRQMLVRTGDKVRLLTSFYYGNEHHTLSFDLTEAQTGPDGALDPALIDLLRHNHDQLKLDLRSLRSTVGAYVGLKTGEIVRMDSSEKQPLIYKLLLKQALLGYEDDFRKQAEGAVSSGDEGLLKALHPLEDFNRILFNLRTAMYEGKIDEDSRIKPGTLKMDGIEVDIMNISDLSEKLMRHLHSKFREKYAGYDFPDQEQMQNDVRHYRQVGVQVCKMIAAFNEVWKKALTQCSRGNVSAAVLSAELQELNQEVAQAENDLKNYCDMHECAADALAQKLFDAIYEVIDQKLSRSMIIEKELRCGMTNDGQGRGAVR